MQVLAADRSVFAIDHDEIDAGRRDGLSRHGRRDHVGHAS